MKDVLSKKIPGPLLYSLDYRNIEEPPGGSDKARDLLKNFLSDIQ